MRIQFSTQVEGVSSFDVEGVVTREVVHCASLISEALLSLSWSVIGVGCLCLVKV